MAKADKEFKRKQADDAKAKKELAAKAAKGGPLVGGGIKKYQLPLFTLLTDVPGPERSKCKVNGVYYYVLCFGTRFIIYILSSCGHLSMLLPPRSLLSQETLTR
jgi:hypothetical protein